jgi:hypothetical protein
MLTDQDIAEFVKEQQLSEQEIAEVSSTVVSVKVSAIKP